MLPREMGGGGLEGKSAQMPLVFLHRPSASAVSRLSTQRVTGAIVFNSLYSTQYTDEISATNLAKFYDVDIKEDDTKIRTTRKKNLEGKN